MSSEQAQQATDPAWTSHAEDRPDSPGVVEKLLSRPVRGNGESQQEDPGLAENQTRVEGIVIGHLVQSPAEGAKEGERRALVDYPNNPARRPLATLSTVAIGAEDKGRKVALAFEEGDPLKPLLIGFINHDYTDSQNRDHVPATDDGKRLVLTAENEIELRCGKSSITLTRAGKVLIRGAYLLNRSSGVNRIKGGSVQIN